jgi:tetratricopeptide (TPR) repeat protein
MASRSSAFALGEREPVDVTGANPADTVQRRLANFREAVARAAPGPRDGRLAIQPPRQPPELAERLAAAVDGEVVRSRGGTFLRIEGPTVSIPVDRERLAWLPGQPPADAPLLCLDTETTGLATAAGTLAFLVGLGWWEADRFRQLQLLMPDQSDEAALLDELAARIPADAWLVTYNGRGFDWPLLTTRFRMAGHGPPAHAGHLDLLPLVRRVFRHRMIDARLRTVEDSLLGIERHEDIEGWEIPGRYLDFLRGGSPLPLVAVARHNAQDVVALARLLAHVDQGYADPQRWREAPHGDLCGLARALARVRRLDEALAALDQAIRKAAPEPDPFAHRPAPQSDDPPDDGWWLPRTRADFGGRPRVGDRLRRAIQTADRLVDPWTVERICIERARILRRLGRFEEAIGAWITIADRGGTRAILAWIEIAKLREHRLGDPAGAMEAVRSGWRQAERSRRLGRPLPRAEADLVVRGRRLRDRLARASRSRAVATGAALN